MNDLSTYYQLRPNMKTGDQLGFDNVGVVPETISWWTRNEVDPQHPIRLSHWGGIIRYPQYEGGEERRYTVEAESNGFQPRILSDYIKDYKGHIYYYALKDEWDPYRDMMGAEIMSMYGIGYDFLGAIKCGLMKTSINLRKLFCSVGWEVGCLNTAPQLCNDVKGISLVPCAMWKLGCFKSPVKLI